MLEHIKQSFGNVRIWDFPEWGIINLLLDA